MNKDQKSKFLKIYKDALQPPFAGGLREWVEAYVDLPYAYALPGKIDLSISPYLLAPAAALTDSKIVQVNLCCATQIGKSFLSELFLPFITVTAPGPAMRVFHSQEVSDIFTTTRLVPLMKGCKLIAPLLAYDRFSTGKSGIKMPHMSIVCGSSNTALQHGLSIKYLLCDEVHQFEPGQFNKFLARTTAFSGRRKIVCASQPSRSGHEWEQIAYRGLVHEWQWLCPACSRRQPFEWSKERDDGSFLGFNWDTILNEDGESTNIAESSKTTWLECDCGHKILDTPAQRRYLNDTGCYVCIKTDGDPSVITYMCPCWVNPNISFASKSAEYLIARRTKRLTGLDELMEIFVTQSLGKFYKQEAQIELSQILTEAYATDLSRDKDWYLTMGVDCQKIGLIKFYTIRAWKKDGSESRRLAFGIARSFAEIEEIRIKHNILRPMVHVDSGSDLAHEVYQECLKYGEVVKLQSGLQYVSWTPTKGDGQKVSYRHKDNITRLFSEISPQDSGYPAGHRLHGIPAGLILFSNFSLKTILGNLRDNKVPGVSWKIDHPDSDYDLQMYSEGLKDVVDKRSGLITQRWMKTRQENHFWDAEVLCLLGALRANVFAATQLNEADIKKIIDNSVSLTPVLP